MSQDYCQRPINPYRYESIINHGGKTLLDVGCGNGSYVLRLNSETKIDAVGADWQEFPSWKNMPSKFFIGDIEKMDIKKNIYDTITAFEVFEHLHDPKIMAQKLFNACIKNIIVTVPNCDISNGMKKSFLTYYHYTDSTHVNFFTLETISKLFENVGFIIKEKTFINPIEIDSLLMECYSLDGFSGRLLKGVLRRKRINKLFLTCLIVAEKPC